MNNILRPDSWGLATRVVVAATVLLAALLGIILVSYGRATDERRRAEVENAVALGQMVAGLIESFAQDLETTTLAASLAVGSDSDPIDQESFGPYLRVLSNEVGILRSLFVTDTQARVIAASTGEGIGTDLSTRPYIESLRRGANTVWGPSVTGILSGEVTVTFSRRILSPNGALRGFMVAAFYPPRLAERLAGRIPADADVTLIDDSGFILHSTTHPVLTAEQRDSSRSTRVQAALAGEMVRVDGDPGFFVDEPRFGVVAPVPVAHWAVAFTRPLDPLEDRLGAQFRQQAGAVAIAVLLVAALLALATRRIAQPLEQLAEAAGALERGEAPTIPDLEGTGEVSQLAAAMSAMSAAVTQREDALRAQTESLEQAIRARDEFLALVSHDLKNPLSAIRNTASLIQRQVDRGTRVDPAVLARATELIDRATVRAAAQIDELLDIAQLQSGQRLELARKPTDLVGLVRGVVSEHQQLSDRHQLSLESDQVQLEGEWDPARLERAVTNLVDNAIKYSPDGGEVKIALRREGNFAICEITDQGMGIPESAKPHIFERFYRADNVAGVIAGTGLGLSGVRYVIEEHGGTVDVVSQEAKGSTFQIRLPIQPTASGAKDASA